jgi:hypothetical protein
MKNDKANSYMKNKQIVKNNGGLMNYRYQMVEFAKKYGVSSAARQFITTRKTVLKWVKAHKESGFYGLKNQSRLKQNHPNKVSDQIVSEIIAYREDTGFGAYYIKDNLNLNISLKTIHKKLKQNDLVEKQRTKYQKKKDMSDMRKATKPFEKIQIDIKYLDDIPNYYFYYKLYNLPKYQITARDYKTGVTFIGYTNEKTQHSVAVFIQHLIFLFKVCGIDVGKISFQSDNGTEFRNISNPEKPSLYEMVLMKHNIKYNFIPVKAPTFNSDVESFHGRIEKEFYDKEEITCVKSLKLKSWFYMVWYNKLRKNRNKGHMSPASMLKAEGCKSINKLITARPVFIDEYNGMDYIYKNSGYLKWLSLIKY